VKGKRHSDGGNGLRAGLDAGAFTEVD
jgi:hypothetical protein